jgi:hypothetical protein
MKILVANEKAGHNLQNPFLLVYMQVSSGQIFIYTETFPISLICAATNQVQMVIYFQTS